MEAAVVFKERGAWKERGIYLVRNKEVFDAEIHAVYQAMRTLDNRDESGQRYTIFSDSQAAISRIQHDRTGPGQAQALLIIEVASTIADRDNHITIRWTPSHAGVEGNERADRRARGAAEGIEERAPPTTSRKQAYPTYRG